MSDLRGGGGGGGGGGEGIDHQLFITDSFITMQWWHDLKGLNVTEC